MNISTFTTKDLRYILITLVLEQRGVTENICGFDTTLCEVTEDSSDKIEITFADEENGLLDVQWSLHYGESYDEAGDAWTFRYQTIIETNIVKMYLNMKKETTGL